MGDFIPKTCPTCHGSGMNWNTRKPCGTCKGKGNVLTRELKNQDKKK